MTDKTEIIKIEKKDGKNIITYQKSMVVGAPTDTELANTIKVAIKLQADHYISKLSKGIPLTDKEVTSLSQLGNTIKNLSNLEQPPETADAKSNKDIEIFKSLIFRKLSEPVKETQE